MIDWWKKVVFENYANFSGRARRSEYWFFTLGQICLWIPLYIILLSGMGDDNETTAMVILGVFGLVMRATLIPTLAVSVRRLHDLGKSGGWYFLIFVPFGSIVLLVWFCTEGERFPNKYGGDPKNIDGLLFDFEPTTKLIKKSPLHSGDFFNNYFLFDSYSYSFAMAAKFRRIHALNGSNAIAEIAFMAYKQRIFKHIRTTGQPAEEEIGAGIFGAFIIT